MTLVQKRLLGMGALVAASVAAAYVVYWSDERAEADKKADAAEKKVMTFANTSQVREIELSGEKGSYRLVYEALADGSSRWLITEPVRTAAEASTVDGLLDALAALSRTGKVEGEGAKELSLFGLDHPRYLLTIKDAAGKSETLLAGKKNSFDGSLYVKHPDDAFVSLVGGGLEYQLEKDLFGLRDKNLVTFKSDEVTKLSVSLSQKRPGYSLEKRDGIWMLTDPKETPADSVQVSAMLSALSSVAAKGFVVESQTPVDLKAAQLDRPEADVRLALPSGELRLLFSQVEQGKQGESARYYATVAGGGPILELSSDWALGKLRLKAEDLRDRHVAIFDRQSVGTLELEKNGVRLSFTRKPEGDGETWEMTAPEQHKAQDATLAGLVYRLWSMKAKHVAVEKAGDKELKDAGLDAPVATVVLKRPDGTPLVRFAFGKQEGENQLVTAGTRIDVVDKSLLEEISTNVTDYKEEDEATAKAP